MRELPSLFQNARLFHAARPTDVNTYYRDGILPLDIAVASKCARAFFMERAPELTNDHLDVAITEMSIGPRNGLLYLSLDERNHYTTCGHYLIYGSEYVCGIAAKLEQQTGRDYQYLLRQVGRPTMFTCEVPLTWLPECSLRELTLQLLEEMAAWHEFHDSHVQIESIAFCVKQHIPAQYIVGHTHPDDIPDPLRNLIPYRYSSD